MSIAAYLEIIDDLKRHQYDISENSKKRLVKTEDEFVEVETQHLEPGYILKLHKNDSVPADVVILHSSDPEGLVHVDTSGIDGENNLKLKYPVFNDEVDFKNGEIHLEPVLKIDEINGRISLKDKNYPLTTFNFVLKGCVIKHTDFVLALVLFSGKNCKMAASISQAKSKRTKMDSLRNKHLFFIFVFVLLLSLLFTIGNRMYTVLYLKEKRKSYIWTFSRFFLGGTIPNHEFN